VRSLATVSLKQRQRAALLWRKWRDNGEPLILTASRAYVLTGLRRYAFGDPDRAVTLSEAALYTTISKKGGGA